MQVQVQTDGERDPPGSGLVWSGLGWWVSPETPWYKAGKAQERAGLALGLRWARAWGHSVAMYLRTSAIGLRSPVSSLQVCRNRHRALVPDGTPARPAGKGGAYYYISLYKGAPPAQSPSYDLRLALVRDGLWWAFPDPCPLLQVDPSVRR